jgi:subtilisin family serine protease
MNSDCFMCTELVTTGYGSLDGTSQAAPHVACVAALLWSSAPSAGADYIHNALRASAEDLGDARPGSFYGYGRLRVRQGLSILNATFTGDEPLQVWQESSTDPNSVETVTCSHEEYLVEMKVMTDYYGNETA